MLIYNKLTEIFADFRHFCRAVILLIFSYLHYQNSINAARWRHAGGGGLEIIVNKNLRKGSGTRRRPRCKYQAVHIQLSFVPYWSSTPFINGRCTDMKRRPPLAEAVFINVCHLLVIGSFWALNSPHRRLLAACGTLCCKYVNDWNSCYLCLLWFESVHRPAGRCWQGL